MQIMAESEITEEEAKTKSKGQSDDVKTVVLFSFGIPSKLGIF